MLFITRPWSLFFTVIALFSVIFPIYQKQRGTGSMLEKLYSPMMLLALGTPLFMMGGVLRTLLAIAAVTIGAYLVWRRIGQQKPAQKKS